MIRNTDWPSETASNEAAPSPAAAENKSPLSSNEEVCHPRISLQDDSLAFSKGSLRFKMMECAASVSSHPTPVAPPSSLSPPLLKGKCPSPKIEEKDAVATLHPQSRIYRDVTETFNDSGLKSTGSADSAFLRCFQESLDSLALSSDEDDDLIKYASSYPRETGGAHGDLVKWRSVEEGNPSSTTEPILVAAQQATQSLSEEVKRKTRAAEGSVSATDSSNEVIKDILKDSSSRPGRSPKRRPRKLGKQHTRCTPTPPLETNEEAQEQRKDSQLIGKADSSPPRHPGTPSAHYQYSSPCAENVTQHLSTISPKASSSASKSGSSISQYSKDHSSSCQTDNSCSIQSSLTSLPTCDSIRSSNISMLSQGSLATMPSLGTQHVDDSSVSPREQFLLQVAGDNDSMASMPSLTSIHLDDSSHRSIRFRDSCNSPHSIGYASLDDSFHGVKLSKKLPRDLFKTVPLPLDTSKEGVRRDTLSPVVFQHSKKRLDWDQMLKTQAKDSPPTLVARSLGNSSSQPPSSDSSPQQNSRETDNLKSPIESPKPCFSLISDPMSTPQTRNGKKIVAVIGDNLPPPRQESRGKFKAPRASVDGPPRVARRRRSNSDL